jgi:hypothetical protein
MSYLSPLHRQLRDDIRPPLRAAELILSDKLLPSPWFGKRGYTYDMSLAGEWLQAHELIRAHYDGASQVWTWTRKGELYRARIRAAHITHITDLWQWAREGNGPSVWHGVTNGRPWS